MEEEISKVPSSAASDSSGSESTESESKLMVTSRVRRTTAGNRYHSVVAQEQAAEDEEDDVALLFAEVEGEDEEYHSDEGADDADMSSSDDDDQGPNAAADDLEGEHEIQREAKAERAKKRKADLALTSMSGLRKKPRIDPTSLRRAPAPKPSKRKERVSWLPDQGFAPGRTSLRKQTLEHRAVTHAKLKKNEQQRLKAKSIRAQREKEREADAPREMTQADRLLEAERVERRNAKSLNRWEAMERKRQEEQAAKLAALKDRKLNGAVISVLSARHSFQGWRSKDALEGDTGEVKKRGRKSKAYLEQLAASKLLQEASASKATTPQAALTTQPSDSLLKSDSNPNNITPMGAAPPELTNIDHRNDADAIGISPVQSLPEANDRAEVQTSESTDTRKTDTTATSTSQPRRDQETGSQNPVAMVKVPAHASEQLGDLQESKPDEPQPVSQPLLESQSQPQPSQPVEVAMSEFRGDAVSDNVTMNLAQDPSLNKSDAEAVISDFVDSVIENAILESSDSRATGTDGTADPASMAALSQTRPAPDLQPPAEEAVPVPEVVSIRNLVVLEDFDGLSSQDRSEYNLFYTTRKTTSRPAKHTPELCLITGLPVRYRDPITGMGYHNASAFKKIKELRDHKYVWSSMLGCYAGAANLVARGVPEGFCG